MRDTLTHLVATCDLPRADRSRALLEAIESEPPCQLTRSDQR